MNLNLINKDDGKEYKVYDITYDKTGYPHFLIYKDREWVRMSANILDPIMKKTCRRCLKIIVKLV